MITLRFAVATVSSGAVQSIAYTLSGVLMMKAAFGVRQSQKRTVLSQLPVTSILRSWDHFTHLTGASCCIYAKLDLRQLGGRRGHGLELTCATGIT